MTTRVFGSFQSPDQLLQDQREDAAQHQSSLRRVTGQRRRHRQDGGHAKAGQVGQDHRPHVAGQEQRLQDGDQIARRHDVGDELQPVRHRGDVEQHARQHHRRHHGGEERQLRGDELVARQRRDEQPQAEREDQEQRRRGGEREQCRRETARRTARSPAAPSHAMLPCRARNCSRAWPGSVRPCAPARRACSPSCRAPTRATRRAVSKRAGHRHHHGDDAGHDEVGGAQLRIEPVAILQVDAAGRCEALLRCLTGQPDLERAGDIAFQDARGVRIGARSPPAGPAPARMRSGWRAGRNHRAPPGCRARGRRSAPLSASCMLSARCTDR